MDSGLYGDCCCSTTSSEKIGLRRKKDRCLPCCVQKLNRVIHDIKLCGVEECQCILVDHANHLYLTDNFVPTHNTNMMVSIIQALKPGTPTLVLSDSKDLTNQNYEELIRWGCAERWSACGRIQET